MEKIYSSKELRKLAEKIIKASPQEFNSENIEDIQTVIQELNVHREQLEVQNDELQNAQEASEREKLYYKQFFSHAPFGIMIIDEKGDISKVNEHAIELFESDEQELLDANIYDLCANEHEKDSLFEKFRMVQKTNKLEQAKQSFQRGHASTFLIHVLIRSFLDVENHIFYYLTLCDISSSDELKSQMQHSSKMEAIGNLAGGIAHDFNNMLSVIIGNTELAIEDSPNYSPIFENLQEIQKASQRAQGVVSQLLTFAQKSSVELKPLQLGKIVESSLNMFRPVIPTSIKINADLKNSTQYVMADATQIHQIFINLLSNSMDAMPSKVGEIKVSLYDESFAAPMDVFGGDLAPGDYVIMEIQDSGEGIDPSLISRIFDPYFSTKDKIKNTGLGLSVVLGIVESLKGGIKINSDSQNGTSFYIYLPVTQKPAKPEVMQKDMPTGSGKIMFIDDEITITKFGSRLIERMGYSVETVNDPIIAVEKFRQSPHAYDLIITDMTMPNMTGDILVQEMKAIRQNLPVIICTGYHENMDRNKAHQLGARYAMKPLNREELARLIHEAMVETD